MNLTAKLGRFLRGAAIAMMVLCAQAWTGEAANASLFALTPNENASTTTSITPPPLSTYEVGIPTGGTVVAETKGIYLTNPPNTQYSNPTVTTTVEEGDPNNPYGSSALSFIFQITNASTTSLLLLTVPGFSNYGPEYASYTGGVGSGWVQPSAVQMTGADNINFVIALKEANGSSPPAVSSELVVYTNATTYAAAADPVSWPASSYHVASYVPTPEPSSLILASTGIVFLLGLGWRRRRA
jgi:hypothetical protein